MDDLDEITKSIFDFFKENEQNEFETFEKKTIEINSIVEAFSSPEKMNTKFVFATPLNKTKLKILDQLADKLFFQIDQIADFEFKGKIYPNVKQKNNDSILTPENWEQYKDIFFEQRMTKYKESYTISEKLKLELETVEKLPINKTDYKILSNRYKDYLINKQEVPILNNTSTTKKYKDYKKENWFLTGIPLATGEAFDLYEKYKGDKGHFTKICLELGFKESDRTFFSTTINDSKKVISNNNTFANSDKLKKLYKHLTENNLPFGAVFLEKYNQIEAE